MAAIFQPYRLSTALVMTGTKFRTRRRPKRNPPVVLRKDQQNGQKGSLHAILTELAVLEVKTLLKTQRQETNHYHLNRLQQR